ncbi:MAG: AMP nucleosidase [Alphaproteobacteria bacterium]
MSANPKQLQNIKPRTFKSADKALEAVREIYDINTAYLHEHFLEFAKGIFPKERVSACYPYVKISTDVNRRPDIRLAYGFVPKPGTYATTLTRPDIFDFYYREQLGLLIDNHGVEIEVGVSDTPIPMHFAMGEDLHLEKDLSPEQVRSVPDFFDVPNLEHLDDDIVNGTYRVQPGEPEPLSLFTAPRVDLSLQRLRHYCGTSPKHFQNYVIFTNYQFYVDEFVRIGRAMMQGKTDVSILERRGSDYTEFVEPGDHVLTRVQGAAEIHDRVPVRMPQMPAYHLKRENGGGITLVNIGVGPSNAKTITDHIAVLRPHAWMMLGHCAGLRNSQNLGDYVLAHGYLREDKILDDDLPPSIPVPALAEIQQALEAAVSVVTGLENFDLKKVMRTGTVATTADRNWELRPFRHQNLRLSQSRAIAMDMESGTIAANGLRFRVPYGTLLCVSDRPLHGQLKLPGMADAFYRERVKQHLQIGLYAMALIRDLTPEKLHSRKLRSFNEVAFQ